MSDWRDDVVKSHPGFSDEKLSLIALCVPTPLNEDNPESSATITEMDEQDKL